MSVKLLQLKHDKLCTLLLSFSLLLLTVSLVVSNILLILFVIAILWKNPNLKYVFTPNVLGWLFIAVFALHVISIFWTVDLDRYFPFLERNLSWVLFPLVLSDRLRVHVDLSLFKKVVFYGLAAIALLNEGLMLYDFITTDVHEKSVRLFFSRYYQLGNAIRISDIHYPYLSLYNAIGLAFGLSILSKGKHILLVSTGIFLLLLYNFQLGSRVFFILNFIFAFFSFILIFKKATRLFRLVLVSLMLVVLWFAKPMLAHSYARLESRLEATFKPRTAPSEFYRPDRWKLCLELISENLALGVGPADVESELQKKYMANGFKISVTEKYNTHNQYLDYLLRFGVIGGLLLIGILGVIIYTSYLDKNYDVMVIFLIFAIAMITENYLSVQRGIVPFCLLATLFINQTFKVKSN